MLSFIFGGSLRGFVVLYIYIIMVVVVVVNSFFKKIKNFFWDLHTAAAGLVAPYI